MSAGSLFEFTITLAGPLELSDELVDRLYEAGFSDSLVGMRDGAVYVDVSRLASSRQEAVDSAREQLRSLALQVQSIVDGDD